MRIWADLTAAAHPIVLRPVVERLRAAGHEVEITTRDYGQTLALCRRMGLEAEPFGSHAGAGRLGKARQLASRTRALRRWARGRGFDLALAHGSNDLALAARSLRIPAANMFDYEWATLQHTIGCRTARRVVVPDSIPLERLARYGVDGRKHAPFPGLKEEYYLSDFEPDADVPARLGVEERRILVVLRPPPDVSLYHRQDNPLFPRVLERLGRDDGIHAVVIPRTEEQRRVVVGLDLPSLIVPAEAVDAQSLIALADLVISAGGTMNREAVALGTPVYTTFGGRLGGVDEQLIAEGRLRPLTDPGEIDLVRRRPGRGDTVRRDPQLIADLVLGAAA
jgi:uncharacterized protein